MLEIIVQVSNQRIARQSPSVEIAQSSALFIKLTKPVIGTIMGKVERGPFLLAWRVRRWDVVKWGI